MSGRLPIGRPVFSVAETADAIRELLTRDPMFRDIRVRGEICAPKVYQSTVYFSLKDATAKSATSTTPMIPCVLWGRAGVKTPDVIDGAQVVVSGAIGIYPARGQLQLTVRSITADGDGADAAALERLRLRLQAEGLFDDERKRALPRFPFQIAVISSAKAQGYDDFVKILRRRARHIRITLLESGVQGDGAVAQLLAAFARISPAQFDAVALVRGGGARDDLRIFNDERVVRAIVASPVVVITGVGHESDVTLVDFAADLRASTPTDAATRLAATDELLQIVERMRDLLDRAVDRKLIIARTKLGDLRHRLDRRSPHAKLNARRERLKTVRERLVAAAARSMQRRSDRLEAMREKLKPAAHSALRRLRARRDIAAANIGARNPANVLALGYSIVRHNGRTVSSAESLQPGERVETTFAHGTAELRVESVGSDGR